PVLLPRSEVSRVERAVVRGDGVRIPARVRPSDRGARGDVDGLGIEEVVTSLHRLRSTGRVDGRGSRAGGPDRRGDDEQGEHREGGQAEAGPEREGRYAHRGSTIAFPALWVGATLVGPSGSSAALRASRGR